MPLEVVACRTRDEIMPAITPVYHYFGIHPTPPDAERFVTLFEPSRAFAARMDGAIVGGCASFPFELSVPGGTVRAAGLSVVGVLPTHRRRGILRGMMRAQLDDVHRRGEPLGYLWASEDTIYGRFGYGLASFCGNVDVSKAHTAFALPGPEARGEFRMVDVDTAVADMARVYDRVWMEHPGMFARSADWWRLRRLADPEHRRMGAGILNRVVMYEEGEPRAYAFYRLNQKFEHGTTAGNVDVIEAIGVDARATRDIWRFVLDIDWVARVKGNLLSLDHPLLSLVARPRELGFRLLDGVWVRLVDVPAALAARTLGASEVVVELADAFCPWNAGRWRISPSGTERTQAGAEIACDVMELGSVYLGGFTFLQLARAGRIEELRDGALARADALFTRDREPWCPEIF